MEKLGGRWRLGGAVTLCCWQHVFGNSGWLVGMGMGMERLEQKGLRGQKGIGLVGWLVGSSGWGTFGFRNVLDWNWNLGNDLGSF